MREGFVEFLEISLKSLLGYGDDTPPYMCEYPRVEFAAVSIEGCWVFYGVEEAGIHSGRPEFKIQNAGIWETMGERGNVGC